MKKRLVRRTRHRRLGARVCITQRWAVQNGWWKINPTQGHAAYLEQHRRSRWEAVCAANLSSGRDICKTIHLWFQGDHCVACACEPFDVVHPRSRNRDQQHGHPRHVMIPVLNEVELLEATATMSFKEVMR
jgi:hypothetical protein